HVDGVRDIDDVYRGQVKHTKDALTLLAADLDVNGAVDKWIANNELSKFSELWVNGVVVDWTKLYAQTTPPRMSLPVYPFAKERYWQDTAAAGPMAANGNGIPALH